MRSAVADPRARGANCQSPQQKRRKDRYPLFFQPITSSDFQVKPRRKIWRGAHSVLVLKCDEIGRAGAGIDESKTSGFGLAGGCERQQQQRVMMRKPAPCRSGLLWLGGLLKGNAGGTLVARARHTDSSPRGRVHERAKHGGVDDIRPRDARELRGAFAFARAPDRPHGGC